MLEVTLDESEVVRKYMQNEWMQSLQYYNTLIHELAENKNQVTVLDYRKWSAVDRENKPGFCIVCPLFSIQRGHKTLE